MKFKEGDIVCFKEFSELPDEEAFKRDSAANRFHRRNIGIRMRVSEVEKQSSGAKVRLDNMLYNILLKAVRLKKCNMIELDSKLFEL